MRRALLRWLGAADAGHVAQLDGRVRELSRMVTALAWVEAEVAAPDYSAERAEMADAHLAVAARDWMAAQEGSTRLPQIRMRPPADDRALAIVWGGVLVLLFTALIMLVCSCTIRGSRDYDEAPPVADMAPADLAADICGTLLPGRMP